MRSIPRNTQKILKFGAKGGKIFNHLPGESTMQYVVVGPPELSTPAKMKHKDDLMIKKRKIMFM